MAMIDYGALLRVNGEFVNKNKFLFMEASNTGYVLEKARYSDISIYDKDVDIDGNFYVCAGDKDLLLTFYKGFFYVISNGLILEAIINVPFISDTSYVGDVGIKVSHLEPDLQIEENDDRWTWKEHVKRNWINTTGEEKLCDLVGGKREYQMFLKYIKRSSRRKAYKHRTQRWIAEWEHNGYKYEVIFGYGIDPIKNVWDEIKNDSYGFTDREIEVIDKWFTE